MPTGLLTEKSPPPIDLIVIPRPDPAHIVLALEESKGEAGSSGPMGPPGVAGAVGPPLQVKGTVPSSSSLPATGNLPGDLWIAADTGHGWSWSGTGWVDTGPIQGPPGPAGPPGAASTVPGPPGPAGPSTVSTNANNKATIGSDSFILVQGVAAGVSATLHAQTVSGDDPALTNARTPTAHASTHRSGGSDVLAIDTLGPASDITALNATLSAHGLLPKLGGGTANFLRADGAWAAPPGANYTGINSVLISGTTVSLVNDSASPGNNVLYGTSGTGVLGYRAASGLPVAYGSLTGLPATFAPSPYYGADTANATAYAVTVGSDFALRVGIVVIVTPSLSCTASPTLNVNATGAKPLVNRANVALAANEILATKSFGVAYDGTSWRVLTPVARVYASSANPLNPSIECAGYDSVSVSLKYSSNANACGLSLAHLGFGVPVYVKIANTSSGGLTYSINATDPTGASVTSGVAAPGDFWVYADSQLGAGQTVTTTSSILSAGLSFVGIGSLTGTGDFILK